MHLNKILEQIKRHQSPSEAIDKLSTALEKHEGSLLEKGFTILKSELAANMYEAINGPHFDWDWYVAMNMIYSDYYKAVVAMTGSANTKHFAELAKAWLCDKDIDEGKMWHYYVYLMCDDDENDYKAYERMHGSHSYRSPEYEHRMGRERGYDYEARSYQYPYSRYDREELDRDSKRYREDDRERMEREREMRDRGLRSTRETRNTSDELYSCCCSCTSCLNINQDIWAAMRVAHIL